MSRYRLLREAVISEGIVGEDQLRIPPAATDEELLLVHSADYIERVTRGTLSRDEVRRIGFPWTPEMVERSRRSTGATIAATQTALESGLGINLAGGTHHAFRDRGAGYCVFNDVAVAIRLHQARGQLRRAVVIDLDVHQGDGTASIFRDDPDVFTASLHGRKTFPCRKQQGSFDLELEPNTGDEAYLRAVDELLSSLPDSSFDIAYFLAGADPFAGDVLGGMAVTQAALRQRDQKVFDWCRQRRVPLVLTMAGGYAHDVRDIVAIQANTVRSAIENWRVQPDQPS